MKSKGAVQLLPELKYDVTEPTQACPTIFVKNCYIDYHENPTEGLVADIRPDGRTDEFYPGETFFQFVKNA